MESVTGACVVWLRVIFLFFFLAVQKHKNTLCLLAASGLVAVVGVLHSYVSYFVF